MHLFVFENNIVIRHLAFAVSRAIMSKLELHVCREAEALLVLFDPIRECKDGMYSFYRLVSH